MAGAAAAPQGGLTVSGGASARSRSRAHPAKPVCLVGDAGEPYASSFSSGGMESRLPCSGAASRRRRIFPTGDFGISSMNT